MIKSMSAVRLRRHRKLHKFPAVEIIVTHGLLTTMLNRVAQTKIAFLGFIAL